MSAIILNMEQYRKPKHFYKKWIVFISKQTNFNIEIGFGTGLNVYYFLKEQNESINRLRRGGSLSGFCGRTGFHELRRRIECHNVLINASK
jgi:hypothetical protein